jgi:hypothetical protein
MSIHEDGIEEAMNLMMKEYQWRKHFYIEWKWKLNLLHLIKSLYTMSYVTNYGDMA